MPLAAAVESLPLVAGPRFPRPLVFPCTVVFSKQPYRCTPCLKWDSFNSVISASSSGSGFLCSRTHVLILGSRASAQLSSNTVSQSPFSYQLSSRSYVYGGPGTALLHGRSGQRHCPCFPVSHLSGSGLPTRLVGQAGTLGPRHCLCPTFCSIPKSLSAQTILIVVAAVTLTCHPAPHDSKGLLTGSVARPTPPPVHLPWLAMLAVNLIKPCLVGALPSLKSPRAPHYCL